MISPRNKTEDLLLSITKSCETLIKRTHTKPQETLEVKITKPKETFSFKQSLNLGFDSSWKIRLTSLDVYNSIFNVTEENNKFELYTDTLDEFHLKNKKMKLKQSLVFQILHHLIYNMKK